MKLKQINISSVEDYTRVGQIFLGMDADTILIISGMGQTNAVRWKFNDYFPEGGFTGENVVSQTYPSHIDQEGPAEEIFGIIICESPPGEYWGYIERCYFGLEIAEIEVIK